MTKIMQRTIDYMNGTGHVQVLRTRLRDRLSPCEAAECEQILDAILVRVVEIASDEAGHGRKSRSMIARAQETTEPVPVPGCRVCAAQQVLRNAGRAIAPRAQETEVRP